MARILDTLCEFVDVMSEETHGEFAEFDPTKHGLQDSFRLTDYANLKGWGCKVPQKILLKLLEGLKRREDKRSEVSSQSTEPRIGIIVK